MAFLTSTQLLNAYDDRKIRQLLSDTSTPVTGDLSSNAVLTQLMREAESEVLASCETGERYTEAQLQELADSATSYGGFLLRRLCADLTMALLVSRRAQSAADTDRQVPRYAAARQQLELLRLGSRVFPGIEEAADAGLPALGNQNPSLSRTRPTLFTDQAHRVFPYRCDRGRPGNDGCNSGC